MYYVLIALAFAAFFYVAYLHRSASGSDHEGKADSVGFFKLTMSLLATAVGGGLIFGLISFGTSAGTIGILLAAVYLLSYMAIGLLAPSIRRACKTMLTRIAAAKGEPVAISSLLAYKYDRFAWGAVLTAYSLVYVAFLAAQYVALGKIIEVMQLGLPVTTTIVVSAIALLVYVSFGGFRSVLASDVIQMIVIAMVLLGTIVVLWEHGDFDTTKLPQGYWDPFASPKSTSTFVWLAVFIFPSLLLRLDHWQRITSASSDATARWSYVTAGIVLVPVFLVLLGVGAATKIAGQQSPFYLYDVFILGSGGWWNRLGYGIVMVAFLCAIVSSGDTILNSAATNIAKTLRCWRLVQTESSAVIVVSSIVLTALALVLALVWRDIVGLITEGFKVLTIILPSITAALILKKPSNAAAICSVTAGLLAYGICKLQVSEIGEWAYVIGFAVSVVAMLLVSRIVRIMS